MIKSSPTVLVKKYSLLLKERFILFAKQKPYLFAFCIFVVASHLVLFVYSVYRKTPKKPLNHLKLAVKTYSLPESAPIEKSPLKTVSSFGTFSSQVASNPEKKNPAKKVQKNKTRVATNKSKTESNKKVSTQRKKLIQELQESIAKIDSKRDNISSNASVTVPKPIKELKADSYEIKADIEDEKDSPIAYSVLLVQHLKNTLCLPGFGSVKIKLTLAARGAVEKLEIIASDSEVNRLYLEKNLQELSYPMFTEELAGEATHTFALTFCSD